MPHRLSELAVTGLRAARVPGNVIARIQALAEEVEEAYGIYELKQLLSLPDWNLWLALVKSFLQQAQKILRREGYCHATYYLIAALMTVDERVSKLIRRWVEDRCRAGLDPCCSSPKCCHLAPA